MAPDQLDAPVIVSNSYQLTRLEMVGWIMLRPLPLALIGGYGAVAGLLIGLGTPAGVFGAAMPFVMIGVMALLTGKRISSLTLEPRVLSVWADGRFGTTLTSSSFNGHLGSCVRVRTWRRGWRLDLPSGLFVPVPRRALGPFDAERFSELIKGRRSPGAPVSAYTMDPLSTLSYDAVWGDLFLWVLWKRRLALAVVLACAVLSALLTDDSVILRAVRVVAPVMAAPLMLAVILAFQLRKPAFKNQRVAIVPGGLEAYTLAGSSHIVGIELSAINATRWGLEVSMPRLTLIPNRAFRDDEHRRQFELALRGLAEGATA